MGVNLVSGTRAGIDHGATFRKVFYNERKGLFLREGC